MGDTLIAQILRYNDPGRDLEIFESEETMRQISNYEKVTFDKEKIMEDLSVVPYFDDISFAVDTFYVTLSKIPGHDILPYPQMGQAVVNNCDVMSNLIDAYRRDNNRKSLGDVARMVWGSNYHNSGQHWYVIHLHVNLFDYCDSNNLSVIVEEDVSKIPYLRLTGKNLLCTLGFHKWEKEPKIKDYIKITGFDVIFWSSGIQKGIVRCQRCGKRKKVYREGWVGSMPEASVWKNLNSSFEKEIDSLIRA